MELSIYHIIKRPIVTTKSVDIYKKFGQYTFEIHKEANKSMVRDAVEKLWNVKVDKVRTVGIVGKKKVFNRKEYESASRKKAIVTLKKGYKIEVPGLFESMASEQPPASAKTEAEGS
jgi:large subunit ribosomal protein L23